MPQLARYHSENFLISVECNNEKYKLLRLQFYNTNNSQCLFLESPWLENIGGLVSIGKCLAGSRTTTIDLEDGGKITSHLVKYNHPLDGNVHFSQDGKIYSLKKNGIPFEKVNGHMFSVYIHNLIGFEKIKDSIKKKYKTLNFKIDNHITSFKILGYLYKNSSLSQIARKAQRVLGPEGYILKPGEKKKAAFYLSSPIGTATDDYTLIITIAPIKPFSAKKETQLLFIGGFDSEEIINNYSIDTQMLVMSYPINNLEELKQRLGCIDYARNDTNPFQQS